MGTPSEVVVGPGLLYVAPIGTAEPTTGSGALPSAWTPIGYTDDGTTFSYGTTFEDIDVAEELDPIRKVATKRQVSLKCAMAQVSAQTLSIAANGGTIGSPTTGFVTFDPPELGQEAAVMVAWDSDDHQERILIRKAIQVGAVDEARKKAPNKAMIPIELAGQVPDDGSGIYRRWIASARAHGGPHA
jgi:hypothetical protein